MSPIILKIIAIATAVLYYLTFGLLFSKKLKFSAKFTWGAAFVLNISLVVNNWIVNGYVPFVSMYQVLTFLGMCFLPLFLYVHFMYKFDWMAKYFALAAALIMTGVSSMNATSKWTFPPALQSVWFVPHVLVYMFAYSLGTVAFFVTILSYINKNPKKQTILDNGVYVLSRIAFPFLTAGMLIGAVWANEVWGNFWSWDIKENWALMTWLMFMLYLHFRRHKSTVKYSKLFVILGFICIIVTLFFVNIIGAGSRHAYSV